MWNRKLRKIICIRCGEIVETKAPNTKYCKGCKKIVTKEIDNKCYRKNRELRKFKSREYGLKHKDRHLKNKVRITCNHCRLLKPHYAKGLCKKCYRKWFYLNDKIKDMSDFEKYDYLTGRGLLDDKKELTVEDLKRDLGVA